MTDVGLVRRRRMEPQAIKLTRAVVGYPAVSYKMPPNQIGYIRSDVGIELTAARSGSAGLKMTARSIEMSLLGAK